MMREILFRGKRMDNGEWVTGHLLRYEDGRARINPSHTDVFCYENDRSTIQTVAHEVDPETVGQFTGLTDRSGKNGKKIFEGDIIKGLFLFGMEFKSVVVFKDGAFGLRWNRGEVKEFSAFTSICNVQYEIVGNIHDNPELLEG